MTGKLSNSPPLLAAVLLIAAAGGCQTHWFARGGGQELESAPRPAATALPTQPATKPLPVRDSAPKADKAAADNDEASQAEVMREVQAIRAQDPAAGRKLLDELSNAEPKLWPVVIRQFRTRQAMHEQLRAKKEAKAQTVKQRELEIAANEPPSEVVGHLTDPRKIQPDARLEEAFAKATPAFMPPPTDPADVSVPINHIANTSPAAIADDAAAVPLAAAPPTPTQIAAQVTPAVAAMTADAKPPAIEQAIYHSDATATTASAAAQVAPALDWQQHVKLAVDDLQARLVDGPRSTAEVHQLVSLRLMQLMAGDTEAALAPIPNVSTQEQDFWSGQIFALATFLDHHRQPDDDRRAAASVVHLDRAVGHLRELGSLTLHNLVFCKNVFGYGVYEAIENPTFTPGQQVTLYLEVENYHSESTAKGYTTLLGASYEIVSDEGVRLTGGDFPNVEDTCQSRRRDFHIEYGLVLPKSAKAGKYQLKLVMNDRQSDKIGNASIAFEIR